MALPSLDSFDATYGGIKQDYTQPVDPATDLPAEAMNHVRASAAGMTRVCKKIFVIWENDGTDAIINDFDSVIGNGSENYPVISKVGSGQWQFTFPATCTDFLGSEQFWNFRYATGDAFLFAFPVKVQTIISAPNQVQVYLFDLNSLSLDDLPGISLLLEIY